MGEVRISQGNLSESISIILGDKEYNMIKNIRHLLMIGTFLLFSVTDVKPAHPQIFTARWLGGTGYYSDPFNWSISQVPCNEFFFTDYFVLIHPGSGTITSNQNCGVTFFALGPGYVFLATSQFFPVKNVYSVGGIGIGQADIAGTIWGDEGDFNARNVVLYGTARFIADNGANIEIGANTYAPTAADSTTLLSAEGFSTIWLSTLDFSSLEEIDASTSNLSQTPIVLTITATDFAQIKLPALKTIYASNETSDWFHFEIGSTGSGGDLIIGNLANVSGAGNVRININHPLSKLVAPASFQPAAKLELNTLPTAEGSKVIIGQNFIFHHVDETMFHFEPAVVQMNGTSEQLLEVASLDSGPTGTTINNFAFGQLYVGQPTQATDVHLVDSVDNANGHDVCGTGEALYLLGLAESAMDGLYIKGGSTLYLDSRNAYAMISGYMTDLQALLGEDDIIAFDEGFIARGTSLEQRDYDGDTIPDINDNCPLVANVDQRDVDGDGIGSICDPDFNNDLMINAPDLAYMKANYFSNDPNADLDNSGFVNSIDLAILKRMYFQTPGPSCVAP